MTIQEIQRRLAKMRRIAGDDEAAHDEEDALYFDFISDIAESDSPYAEEAKLVLTSHDIDFARWCA